jgi:hypothetical protein
MTSCRSKRSLTTFVRPAQAATMSGEALNASSCAYLTLYAKANAVFLRGVRLRLQGALRL